MEIKTLKTLNETEIKAVNGGFVSVGVYIGIVAGLMAIADYAGDAYEGFTDNRMES